MACKLLAVRIIYTYDEGRTAYEADMGFRVAGYACAACSSVGSTRYAFDILIIRMEKRRHRKIVCDAYKYE